MRTGLLTGALRRLFRGEHVYVGGSCGIASARVAALREARYDLTAREFAGSYSAERGVGPSNAAFYRRTTDAATRDWAAALHRHFDPAALMGNVRLD